MEAALQRRIQRYGWDKAAAYYEELWQNKLKPAQEKMLEMAKLKQGEKLIDIACGTGLVSFPAAKKIGKKGLVLATDISAEMIRICEERARKKKYSNMQFERMDAEELLVTDASFDAASCALGLMYAPDPVKALKEMYRVLKPGGRAVTAVWGKRDHCGWAEIFDIIDRRVATEVCPMFFNLGNRNMLQQSFEEAGFSYVMYKRMSSLLNYDSDEDACVAAFAGGPVAPAYNKFPNEIKKEVHPEYLDSIKCYKQDEGYAIHGEFVVAFGFKSK